MEAAHAVAAIPAVVARLELRLRSRWVAAVAAVAVHKAAVRSQSCLAVVAVDLPVVQPVRPVAAARALMATLTQTTIPTADLRRLPRQMWISVHTWPICNVASSVPGSHPKDKNPSG